MKFPTPPSDSEPPDWSVCFWDCSSEIEDIICVRGGEK